MTTIDTNNQKTYEGMISVTSRGVGYVSIDDYEEDIQIQPEQTNKSLNRDTVKIRILSDDEVSFPTDRIQGQVLEVVKRYKTTFVGTVQKQKEDARFVFVVADNKRMSTDLFVPIEKSKDAENGQKVVVEMTDWRDGYDNPQGEITEILGEKGTHEVEMKSILIEKGFDATFPSELTKEAEEIVEKNTPLSKSEVEDRRDMRSHTTFTIDPEDAKDFDDALSLNKIDDDTFEVGIHIADVSHYVKQGSALDKEARERGFSVYLVDRTIPMLPEALSNGICSLSPHTDKLAFSTVFKMNKDGEVQDRWFGKTVITSDKRFAYEDAQAVMDNGTGDFYEELTTLNTIAHALRKQKFNHGAINFETDEVKFDLNKEGEPMKIYKKARLDVHKLIEDFMLLANKEVAELIYKAHKDKGGSFLYRVHDKPDAEKIEDLSILVHALGYELEVGDEGSISSKDLNVLLKKIEGKSEESLIKTAAIKSMSKAIYSVKNTGHFGLAFQYYTHFTSPIRRYADLVVHRLLFKHLNNQPIESDEFARYKKIAENISEKELAATEAERESVKYKQVEYMMSHIGETFDGIISGVTEWGIYIEEKNTMAEGMVSVRTMNDDFYELDKKNYALVGKNSGTRYQLGDEVRFKITDADLDKKQLDYKLV